MSSTGRRDILISGVQFDQELRSGTMSVLELAPIAARLGADGVEYREVYWHDKDRELPALRDQLAELGLKPTFATFTTLYHRDSAKRKQLIQELDDAHALGAPLMRVFRGERPTDASDDAAMVKAARELAERARGYGMRLALENFSGIPGSRPEEIQDVLERIDSPVMGVNIDFANYAVHDIDSIEAIRQLLPWIIYTHLKDAKQTPNGKVNSYLGSGTLPLKEIISALDAAGPDYPFCFEFAGEGDPENGIARSLSYLADLGLGTRR